MVDYVVVTTWWKTGKNKYVFSVLVSQWNGYLKYIHLEIQRVFISLESLIPTLPQPGKPWGRYEEIPGKVIASTLHNDVWCWYMAVFLKYTLHIHIYKCLGIHIIYMCVCTCMYIIWRHMNVLSWSIMCRNIYRTNTEVGTSIFMRVV